MEVECTVDLRYAIYLVQSDSVIIQRYPGIYLSRDYATTAMATLLDNLPSSTTHRFEVMVYDKAWDMSLRNLSQK